MLICLTGAPGIGKTTIIKKLVQYLKDSFVDVGGFFTEEVRNAEGYREGFDIVTVSNQRGILARKSGIKSRLKVGAYSVDIGQFEGLALPSFNDPQRVMIIDEVGKMELFSTSFKEAIENLLNSVDISIVATLPLKSNDPFINHLKKESKMLIHVSV
ncbi:hypothetical protein WA026_011487 [Henosepilachna vigintioctopunctata]|uniref:AAA+ ATPase domain-containing protein n=1 Tax=Henosepilachna vigintioctopunctata TaxID=420089 RepID=A0AAW1TS82_9CUCU